MAKAILNGQEIFGNVHMGEGGASSPIITETVLADNSSAASSFTLSDDMSNYDFIVFKCLNSSSNVVTEFITTPTHLANVLSVTGNSKFTLNEPATNQYVIYSVNGNVFTKSASRNMNITEVRGLKCTNKTVTETVIYLAPSLSSTATPISGTGFFDYDLIFFSGNSASADDMSFDLTPCYKDIFGAEVITHYIQYYGAFVPIYITDTDMSSARYLAVTGIKFS